MAPPANKKVRATNMDRGAGSDRSEVAEIRAQLNNLTTAFRQLCTKLDSNHGAAADHVSTITDSTGTTPPSIIDAVVG